MKMLRKNRKGQIRMSETIAIIFIFFVLILFFLIFYYKYQGIAIQQKNEQFLADQAIAITLKTLNLPELVCSKGDAEPEDNCFDLMKMEHAEKVFSNHLNDYYFEIFSYSRITVSEVFGDGSWILYDKQKPISEDSESKIAGKKTFSVISIKDDTNFANSNYKLGVVEVFVYQ